MRIDTPVPRTGGAVILAFRPGQGGEDNRPQAARCLSVLPGQAWPLDRRGRTERWPTP